MVNFNGRSKRLSFNFFISYNNVFKTSKAFPTLNVLQTDCPRFVFYFMWGKRESLYLFKHTNRFIFYGVYLKLICIFVLYGYEYCRVWVIHFSEKDVGMQLIHISLFVGFIICIFFSFGVMNARFTIKKLLAAFYAQ